MKGTIITLASIYGKVNTVFIIGHICKQKKYQGAVEHFVLKDDMVETGKICNKRIKSESDIVGLRDKHTRHHDDVVNILFLLVLSFFCL